MNILVLTSNSPRHDYLCQVLSSQKDITVCGVVREDKGAYYQSDNEIINRHLGGFRKTEQAFFGDTEPCHNINALNIERGHINDDSVYEWIMEKSPDYIVLFGTGLIKERLLGMFDKRVVNIHLGLSPYYKGTATNFWPLVEGEPQCIGATIHLAVLEVDAGPILHQIRPDMEPGDDCHTIGCKTIKKAINVLPKVLWHYHCGTAAQIVQHGEGRVYRRRDFNADDLIIMQQRMEKGLIRDYLRNKEAIDERFPIIKTKGVD